MGIEEVVIAPRSPWQNPYVERMIGSLRRELLDHVIVLNEAHLCRLVTSYLEYYHTVRPHLSLDRNAPIPRPKQVPSDGNVVAMPCRAWAVCIMAIGASPDPKSSSVQTAS